MSKAMPKILLLDSNALIHRSYHALPPLTSPKGEQVNAVFGFASSLLKAIKDEKPDYVVACFDVGGDRGTFRSEMYPEYKAHRKESDESLYSQIPRVKEIVEVLNIPLFAQQGFEADDLIGSLAQIAKKKGLQTVIVTGDNDALQLVGDSVTVYSLRRGVTDTLTYNRNAVKEKLGIYPEQVVDYKALAGDSSDNIPGAPGIGPKTAVDWLNKYENLDGVYAHLDELKDRPKQILADNKELVYLSQKLATIKKDIDIDLDLKAADVSNFDFAKVVTLFHELDFKSLLAKLPQNTNGSQASLFDSPDQKNLEEKIVPQLPFEAVTTKERWLQLKTLLLEQEKLVIDTETVDFDQELIGVGIAWGPNDAAYLPVTPAYSEGLPLDDVRADLNEILGDPDRKIIGHNIKFDIHALNMAGISVKNVWFDTMIASQLVHSQLFSHGLDALAFSELGFKKIPTVQLLGKKSNKMTSIPLQDLAAYCCEDVLITWRLFEKLYPETQEKDAKRVFYEIEMPLLPVLVKMEARGIELDGPYLEKLGVKLKAELKKIEARVIKAAGQEFNIASPAQLQKILFEKLNLPVIGIKKTLSGYSTDADSLGKLKGKHPIVDDVIQYREMAKLLNTYVETLPKQVDKNSRLHTSYMQLGAATGRLASTNPNLQNIPIKTELGNEVRRAFVAPKGKVLLGADYSQIELRILAHLSEDPDLIAAFHKGDDFHAAVAEQLKVDRRAAKAINFGIIYGLGPNALANDLGITNIEAKEFIDVYFKNFPGVASFIEKMKRQAREQGFVSTMFGRKRYLPDIHSPNMMMRSGAERMAVNMPCQGTVADLMKLAMVEIDRQLPEALMLLQIHDELLFEVDSPGVEALASKIQEIMNGVVELKVPLLVDVKAGPNWADMTEIK
ncbi:MAG TPA: DNA polymerase I [Candidatus Saccharimonadales bacterium]|nr:DNA polymerase I [Candidatus Saccharimonadales bacterium]